jgi:hypothetical protein
MLVDRPPEIVELAADPDEHLVQMPLAARPWPAALERGGEGPPKAQTPSADALVLTTMPRWARISSTSRRLKLKQW